MEQVLSMPSSSCWPRSEYGRARPVMPAGAPLRANGQFRRWRTRHRPEAVVGRSIVERPTFIAGLDEQCRPEKSQDSIRIVASPDVANTGTALPPLSRMRKNVRSGTSLMSWPRRSRPRTSRHGLSCSSLRALDSFQRGGLAQSTARNLPRRRCASKAAFRRLPS